MTYWNHFAKSKYPKILLSDVDIGEKFRSDKWKGKRARRDIVMIKLSELTYQELRSKKTWTVLNPDIAVYAYEVTHPYH